jgi:hypothetical protein
MATRENNQGVPMMKAVGNIMSALQSRQGYQYIIGVFFSTAIVWRFFHPLDCLESSRAHRKAVWKEEKKLRKIQNNTTTKKEKKQKEGVSRALWTVPEDGQRLGSATLAESIRLAPATLLKNSRSNDKLFEMGADALEKHKTSYIYVIGGRLRGRTLTNVERFNLTTYTWEKCAYLAENRGSHGAGCLNGEVYAVGGGGLRANLRSCEKLGVDGSWSASASISIPRHALCVVSVPERNGENACLYAIGGWCYGSEGSALMERYDGEQWVQCAPMQKPRRLHGACYCPIDGCIYVFGGNVDEDGADGNFVDCYCCVADQWQPRKPLPVGACCCAATVGERYIYVALFGRGMVRPRKEKKFIIHCVCVCVKSVFFLDIVLCMNFSTF